MLVASDGCTEAALVARYISPLATDTEVNNCYLTLFIYAIYFMSKLWIFFFHSQGDLLSQTR